MIKEPLISVIIPTYNYGSFINFTLDCVLNQHYRNIEVIVIDDGSTDHTRQILNIYSQKDIRIKYYYQENKGLSSARNLGLEKSKGDFIQFLDADDLISDFKLALQIEAFRINPEVDVSYTKCYYFVDGKPDALFAGLDLTDDHRMPEICNQGFDAIRAFVISNIMPVNSALISRRVLDWVPSFNERYKSLEDWDFWLRCAFKNVYFEYLSDNQAFGLIRVHQHSMSQNRSRMHEYELELRQDIEVYLTEMKSFKKIQVDSLRTINNKEIKNRLSLIISNLSLIDTPIIKRLLKRTGSYMFFTACLKAINDRRKVWFS